MFKFKPNDASLYDALHTDNHFLPIIICSLVSLFLLYYSEQFTIGNSSTSQLTGANSLNRSRALNRRAENLIYNVQIIGYRVGFVNVVAYTLVTIMSGTFLLVYLVKKRYFTIIKYWFVTAYFLVLFVINCFLLSIVLNENHFYIFDLFTVLLFLWNLCRY